MIDYETDVTIKTDRVIPELSSSQIEKSLKENGISFDLHTKLKEASLSMLPNASIQRSKLVLETAQYLQNIIPLKINGFQFAIEKEPTFLLNAPASQSEQKSILPLTVFHDLQEPEVFF